MSSRLNKPKAPRYAETPDDIPQTSRGAALSQVRSRSRMEIYRQKENHRETSILNGINGKRVRPVYTLTWLKRLATAARMFTEFTEEILLANPGEPNHGRSFFSEGKPFPPMEVLRKFLAWYADSGKGMIANSSWTLDETIINTNLSVVTVKGMGTALLSAIAYWNKQPDIEFRKQLSLWVEGSIADDLDLVKNKKAKPVTYEQDVAVAIAAIWDHRSSAVLKTFRARVYATTILNLLVDNTGRIGEILPLRSDTVENKWLSWECMEFLAFSGTDGIGIDILVMATFKWLKGGAHDVNMYKTIPLHFLPPHMVFQDSTRMLVHLALMKAIFEDFRSWDELMSCKPLKTGSVIRIKKSVMRFPVFSKDAITGLDEDVNKAWSYEDMEALMAPISRLAHFGQKMLLHSLRRGGAFILNKAVNKEDARILMGQKPTSDAFLEYFSKTSTTDVQSLARGLPAQDLRIMSSIGLSRPDSTPEALGGAAWDKLHADMRYVALRQALADETKKWQALANTVGSRKIAKDEFSEQWRAKRAAEKSASSYTRRFMEREYNAEYARAYREAVTARPEAMPVDTITQTSAMNEEEQEQLEVPTLTEGMNHMTLEEAEGLVDDLEALAESSDMAGESQLDVEEEDLDAALQMMENRSCRTHHIYRGGLNEMVGAAGRKNTIVNSFSPLTIVLKDIFETITEDENITGGEVNIAMMDLDRADIFRNTLPPHWRSDIVGNCVICNMVLDDKHAYRHVLECFSKEIRAKAAQKWQSIMDSIPLIPCTIIPKKHSQCGYKSDDPKDMHLHLRHHFSRNMTARRYVCKFAECLIEFNTKSDLHVHLVSQHKFHFLNSENELYIWCRYCEGYLEYSTHTLEREEHFKHHLQEAHDHVKHYGYTGVELFSKDQNGKPKIRAVIGRQCIFCLHDRSLSAEERIAHAQFYVDAASAHSTHVDGHVKRIGDGKVYCPASKLGGADIPMCLLKCKLGSEEMALHLKSVHGITLKAHTQRKGKKESDEKEHNVNAKPSRKKRKMGQDVVDLFESERGSTDQHGESLQGLQDLQGRIVTRKEGIDVQPSAVRINKGKGKA